MGRAKEARAKLEQDRKTSPAGKCPRAECSQAFTAAEMKDGLTPYHDFPPPCRSVCMGSKQPPLPL